jgi:hypothetical protein
MKKGMQFGFIMFLLGLFGTMSVSAQRQDDYAYQRSNDTYNNNNAHRNNPNGSKYDNDTYRGNPNGYNTARDNYYQKAYGYNNSAACVQNRRYFATSPELQRLYQIEDALLRRYDADVALGDRRAARKDLDRLEDVQRDIIKAEMRYARANPNYRMNNRDARYGHDRDRDRGRH